MAAALFKQPSREEAGKPGGGPGERPDAAAAEADRPPAAAGRAGAASGGSLVAADAEVSGEVSARDDLRIEGKVTGDVQVGGELFVAAGASVRGEIVARAVTVEGRVEGRIAAREVVRFRRGCRAAADVRSPSVALEEGGRLDGRLEMRAVAAAPPDAAAGGSAGGEAASPGSGDDASSSGRSGSDASRPEDGA